MPRRQLLFVRHGESEGNQNKIIQGKLDQFGLTSQGKSQISSTVGIISSYNPSIIISSPLKRTMESSQIYNKLLDTNPPIQAEPLLEEIGFGLLEGLTHYQRNSMYSSEWKYIKENNYDFSILKGEPLSAAQRRAAEFKTKIQPLMKNNQTLLIVTHGGILRCILDSFIPEISRQFSVENASVFSVTMIHDNYQIIKLKGELF